VRRLVVLLVALLAAWLGVFKLPVVAPHTAALVVTYAYGAHHDLTLIISSSDERGPPRSIDDVAAAEGLGSGSHDTAPGTHLPRVAAAATRSDSCAPSVQSDGSTTTTSTGTYALRTPLSDVAGRSVAAKTVPEVVGPARSTDLVLDSFRGLGPGKQKTVRTVGSVDEMRATFDAWSVGAERLPARGPKIPDVYRLPDGGVIHWRAGSTTGGPTIDILPVGGAPRKVHLADGVAW
jgi:hypothetical protein